MAVLEERPSPASSSGDSECSSRSGLEQVLYSRGFVDGLFSDLTVHALGVDFQLHRIVLLSNPYFAGMLDGGPWKEHQKGSISIQFDDPNVTVEAVRSVFARIYGQTHTAVTGNNARSLLAAGLFFGDLALCQQCVQFMVNDIHVNTVLDYLTFCDDFCYGEHSEAIINAAVTFICRYGFSDLHSSLSRLPLHWIARIVASDSFYCPCELSRYEVLRDVLLERRKQRAAVTGRVDSASACSSGDGCLDVSSTSSGDSDQDSTYSSTLHESVDEDDKAELQLLSHAVQYSHILFEDLQSIQQEGLVPRRTLQKAFWDQKVLEQLVLRAPPDANELGITYTRPGQGRAHQQPKGSSKHSMPVDDTDHINSQFVDTIVHGPLFPHRGLPFPPFRFSVEFTNLHELANGGKLISRQVHYAGSNWHVYLQGVNDGTPKVGIYLQRMPVNQWTDGFEDAAHNDRSKGSTDGSAAKDSNTDPKPSRVRLEDARIQTQTWFRIHCFFPSTCYILESKPDTFRLHQSWGWRSHKLYNDSIGPLSGRKTSAASVTLRCAVVIGHV
ncbi:hypothetical protein BC831DRAFT_460988 [Entophlyctis helioformis]|nr:hypothetical protein BC831DRAFT_460988 [Entophlyctis helioformis]